MKASIFRLTQSQYPIWMKTPEKFNPIEVVAKDDFDEEISDEFFLEQIKLYCVELGEDDQQQRYRYAYQLN